MEQHNRLQTLLSAKSVGLTYVDKETGKKNIIIKDASFDIKDVSGAGQIVSLIGKSGEGKSTLLRMLSGLPMPNSIREGEISIHHDKVQGEHILTDVKEGDMGIVFQDYYMPENYRLYKMLYKSAVKNPDFKSKKEIEEAIDWYINEFELSEHKNKYPCQLSGGQKQRASISLQLLNGSNFLLMDEPFSGLDPIMIDKTTRFLQKAANSNELKTLIIVSHDLINCIAISDTVYVLSRKGREEGTGATIVADIDLIANGLAYHDDIKRMPEFHNMISEIKNLL